MQINRSDRALYLKIVYYGPGLSGKTTNLETLHRLTDPDENQPLVSLKTEQDRTLFFDLLPFDLGRLAGLDVRFKLYTVPGQIQYDTTRKQVLAGADSVVFVADSQARQQGENVRMIQYLKNNLSANGLDPETLPILFQWNKRDLPSILPAEQMDRELNWRRAPCFESVATDGRGVLETFGEILLVTLQAAVATTRVIPGGLKEDQVRARIGKALAPAVERRDAQLSDGASHAATIAHVHQRPAAAADSEREESRSVLGLDELLSGAVQASVRMSEQLAGSTAREEAWKERWGRERRALTRMIQIARIAGDPGSVHKIALASLLAGLGLSRGSVLGYVASDKRMRELAVAGHTADPLNRIESHGIGSVATGLAGRKDPLLVESIRDELMFGQDRAELAELQSVLALPVSGGDQGRFLMLAYTGQRDRDLSAEDAELGSLVTAIAELALRGLPVPAAAR
jgi:hypothetical protein